MAKDEEIIIVNQNDECIGYMEKLLVHRTGILHRAFSVLIFDNNGNMLIQQRSRAKYHSPLLWSNACCSHQRPEETLEMAAARRVGEELNLYGLKLIEAVKLQYRFAFDNSLIENEIDHVFIAQYQGPVNRFNTDEVAQVAWVSYDILKKDTVQSGKYTVWFKLIIEKLIESGFTI